MAVAATLVNAVLMTVVLVAAEGDRRVFIWLGAVFVLGILRLCLWWRYSRRASPETGAGGWGTAIACATGASGLLWGGGAAWLWPTDEAYRLFWVFVIGGMCTGTVTLQHAHLPTPTAFILLAGTPVASRLAAGGRGEGLAGAAMIVVFLVVLMIGSIRFSRDFGETVGLRLNLARRTRELDAARAQLVAEMADHQATEASLRHAQKMEAVGQLAGGIAHDFNNILQAVSGGAALIRRRARDPGIEQLAGMVADAARRGESITRRLLIFARRGELHAEALDVGELLGGLREVLTATLPPGIQVDVAMPPGLPALLADRSQLETALVNLAVNARDAMPGGGTLTLAASVEHCEAGGGRNLPAPGSYIRLDVSDTGTGMDEATLARACEPFFTTKARGRGTGLGLPMARSFAEGSGGALSVESAPEHGACISIWLPIAAGPAPPAPPPAGAEADLPHAAMRRAAVLLVDDEPLVRTLLAQELAEEGFEVVDAPDGAAALALLDRPVPIDLLVSDLAMPGMDGVALIREARRRCPGLPAILLTGYAGEVAAMAAGGPGDDEAAFALLRKPATGAVLAAQLMALLQVAVPADHRTVRLHPDGNGG